MFSANAGFVIHTAENTAAAAVSPKAVLYTVLNFLCDFTVPVSFAVAALGGEILIDTVDGKVVYDVKAGTQTDTRIRLRGKGVPSLRNKDVRGDHYVTLVVQVPDKLSNEAKELLKQFDKETGNSLEAVKNMENNNNSGSNDEKKKRKFFK